MYDDFTADFNRKYYFILKKQHKLSINKIENHEDSLIANSRFELIFLIYLVVCSIYSFDQTA